MSNAPFSRQAVAAAETEGIALLHIQPIFDSARLSARRSDLILREIQQLAKPAKLLYRHEVIHAALPQSLRVAHLTRQAQRKKKTPSR
jgi:hypothetical protein